MTKYLPEGKVGYLLLTAIEKGDSRSTRGPRAICMAIAGCPDCPPDATKARDHTHLSNGVPQATLLPSLYLIRKLSGTYIETFILCHKKKSKLSGT